MESEKNYIETNYQAFNCLEFFQLFCKEKNTEESKAFFIEVITHIKNEASEDLLAWCENIINNNYIILKTDLMKSFWSLKTEASITKNFNESYRTGILQAIESSSRTVEKRKHVPSSPLLVPRVERDPVLFGRFSVSTIIKKDALYNFLNFANLSDVEQYRISLGLNSTINLTDTKCQEVLFSGAEWNMIKSKYSFKLRHRAKLPKDSKVGIEKINKKLASRRLQEAYKQCRSYEIKTGDVLSSRLYSIFAHIIRVYNERSHILSTSNNGICSENDAIVKLWGEIFELLFGGCSETYLRWGETTSSTSTEQKKLSRPNEKNVIGFKIDCRAVACFEHSGHEVDLMNLEAAKEYSSKKILNDRSKLVAEAKCSLDYFLNSPSLRKSKKDKLSIPIIQIAGSKCEVCSYKLVADGLYVLDSVGSLSIPVLFTEFAETSIKWFKLLLNLKNMVLHLYDASLIMEQKSTDDFVNCNEVFTAPHLTRGTFFPPTKASEIPRLPMSLYHPDSRPIDEAGPSTKARSS